jgi:hypothetical protein
MTKYALLIGNNYKGTACPLNGCINDVLNVRKFLMAKRGFHSENIRVLTDDPNITPGDLSTRENILQWIDKLTSVLREGDTLYVHYSGHGGQSPCVGTDRERSGHDQTIYAKDLVEILDDELKERLVNRIPVGARLRCVLDSCYSGTCIDAPYSLTRTDVYETESDPCAQSDNVIELSGCRDDQTSADSVDSHGLPAGALTAAFLETLETHADWTWAELLTIVRANLRRHHHSQIPQLSMGRRGLEKLIVDI